MFVNVNTHLIRKASRYWEAMKLKMANTGFPKFFHLKAGIFFFFSFWCQICSLFSLK